jgi:hypothetical protein
VVKVPAVVRLLRAFRRRRQRVKFSRVNIYARDKYTCQYCREVRAIGELTYDHVVPRRLGGRTEWTNIVTACQDCNLRKGARTPEQAGMALKARPICPDWVPAVSITVSLRSLRTRGATTCTGPVSSSTTEPPAESTPGAGRVATTARAGR